MATKKKRSSGGEEVNDWVTQAEAAEARGVTVNVVGNWLARGRLRHSKEMYGRRLVSRSEVLNYVPSKGGRPKKGGQR
jgi:predicted site-specific integrase-resolvase